MPDAGPVLVVGAGGFIGRAVVTHLAGDGIKVVAAGRGDLGDGAMVEIRGHGDLGPASDWPAIVAGCGAAVFLASRAHAPPGDQRWSDAEAATASAFAAAAKRAGLERIVLISSLKVIGDDSGAGRLRADAPPAPADAYGHAKLRLETTFRAGLDQRLVVLRPPLVYGPGVKGNFRALLRLVDRSLPLPLAGIRNRRSLVYIDNLVDLVLAALTHPAAPGGTFLVRDDAEVSTPALVRAIALALGRPARLFPCPAGLLRAAARAIGRGDAAERLIGSLSVDDTATRARLGWRPRVGFTAGIAATCAWYQAGPGKNASVRPSR